METRTKLVCCVTNLALIAVLAQTGCAGESSFDFNSRVRPGLDQLVLGGELILDHKFNGIIRRRNSARRDARRPLNGLHEVLKGSDFFRDRTATYVPMGSVFSSKRCAEDADQCPGRVEFVHALTQSGIDAVSLAGPTARQAGESALEETLKHLSRARICAARGDGQAHTCEFKLGETRVSLGALSAASGSEADSAVSRASELVSGARSKADLVVLSVALDPGEKRAKRQRLLVQISDQAKPDVVLGHFDGPFDGVETRENRLIIHNPGTMLTKERPNSDMSEAFLFRIHFTPKGLAWAEGIPIHLLAGRSRQSFLDNSQSTVKRLLDLSAQLSGSVHGEFGRAIIDIRNQ
jgi:hypothetical protein